MSIVKHTHADFMQSSRTMIENALAAPELARALTEYGYDQPRLLAGRQLWEEVDALVKRQSLEKGSKMETVQDMGTTWDKANAAYVKSLKVARIALAEDAKAVAALKLCGPRKQSVAGWLDQAGTFYANLAADGKLREKLGRFGYGQEKLDAETALVEQVREKSQVKVQGTGNSQAATQARDKKLRELDTWISEFRTICRLAFYETPQELEKLGVMALNSKRSPKKSPAQAVTA